MVSHLALQRMLPTKLLDLAPRPPPPLFFSFLSPLPPVRFLLLADRGETLAVIELTRYSSAPGQEGSRAEKHGRKKSFLSVWWRS